MSGYDLISEVLECCGHEIEMSAVCREPYALVAEIEARSLLRVSGHDGILDLQEDVDGYLLDRRMQ